MNKKDRKLFAELDKKIEKGFIETKQQMVLAFLSMAFSALAIFVTLTYDSFEGITKYVMIGASIIVTVIFIYFAYKVYKETKK